MGVSGRADLKRRIVERFERQLDELLGREDGPQTIDEIEDAALRLRAKVGEIAAQEMAEELQREVEAREEEAGSHTQTCSCGHRARYKGQSRRTVVTMAGMVALHRASFYCRLCDHCLYPVDGLLCLPKGAYTERVWRETGRLSALMPFSLAARLLLEYTGVSLCAKEAQRLCGLVGEAAVSHREEERRLALLGEAPEPLSRAPTILYLEADGVHTPMTDGYKEAKVGLARGVSEDREPVGPTQYTGTVADSETFGEHWYALALRAGLKQARAAVVLGDGAAWIWNQAAFHFPRAIQILDIFHVMEHLWEVARAAYAEGDERIKAFADARKADLLDGRVDAVLQALDRLKTEQPCCEEVARQTQDYIENNRSRMQYHRYRELGLAIGSGAAESACKQVVSQRLKGAGMRWKKIGAEAVIALRCLLLSNRWETSNLLTATT